jgi:hypothetical protein
VLELDLAAPVEGWGAFLASRGIEVVLDDIGRLSISRGAARQLFAEKREAEAHAREVAARREREAIEADQQRRAQIWGGAPAVEGVSAAALMLQADKDAQPKRRSVLQEALAGSETLTYHPLPKLEDES